MNPFEMVVLIVGIVMIASVLKARYGLTRDRHGNQVASRPDPDTTRVREEVRALKERVAVLERLITDERGSRDLEREIEALRSRDA